MQNREGQKVPKVTFQVRQDGDWCEVTTDDLFAGKTVAVFSLPGAFTPTCSSSHVPRYNELAATFRENGIDDILCVSVNDTFVMNAWKEDQHADNIRFVPDGNAEFTRGMGMLVDKDNLGFGARSWRYSMIVKDGVIEKMFIEPDVPGDPYEVSDADTMLEHINPNVKKPHDITLVTKPGCGHCDRAKKHLADKNWDYEEVVLGGEITSRSLRALSGKATTPQIFIDGKLIGGADQLEEFLGIKTAAAVG